jgi:hypothetical protein
MSKNIISLLFIVTAVAMFLVWTRPHLREIDSLKIRKDAFNQALADSRELQQLRDALLVKFNSIKTTDLEKFDKMILQAADPTKLMVAVDNMSKASNVILKDFGAEEISEEQAGKGVAPKYKKVQMGITLSASYENFLGFLGQLQKSLRLMDVDKITFNAADEDLYDFNLQAVSYFK